MTADYIQRVRDILEEAEAMLTLEDMIYLLNELHIELEDMQTSLGVYPSEGHFNDVSTDDVE